MARVAILWPDGTGLAVTTPSPGMVAPAPIFWAATTTLSSWCNRIVVPPMIWFISLSSRALDARRVDVDRIERCGRRDKQPVAPLAAESDVGDDLRDFDASEQRAVRRIALDAGMAAGPQVSVHVDPETVRDAGLDVAEHPPIGQFPAVDDIESADVVRRIGVVGCGGVCDVEGLLVRREGKAVGLHEVLDHGRDLASLGVDAIDVAAA